jgi:FkbM family methyltransferase
MSKLEIKMITRKLLATFGFELHRLKSGQARNTEQMALPIAIQNGLQVNTVLDVGAAFGSWTRMCLNFFPCACYVVFEPLSQYDKELTALQNEYQNVRRVKAAVSAYPGQATFFFHEDWVGSSLYQETEGNMVDGQPIQVDTTTIDVLVKQRQLSGPFLLKIDVQGAELQVLDGASTVLHQTEYILLETSLFQFFKNGPLVHDIILYLQQRDFVLYDILNPQYRLLDKALGQVDLVFVPAQSRLRREHVYASPQQRREQTQQYMYSRVLNKIEN